MSDNSSEKKTKLIARSHEPVKEQAQKEKIKVILKKKKSPKNVKKLQSNQDTQNIPNTPNTPNISNKPTDIEKTSVPKKTSTTGPKLQSKYGEVIRPDNVGKDASKDLRTITQKKQKTDQKKQRMGDGQRSRYGQNTKDATTRDTKQTQSSEHRKSYTVKSEFQTGNTNSMTFPFNASQKSGSSLHASSKKSYKTTRKKVFINKKKQDKEKILQPTSKKAIQQVNPVPKKIKIMENITIAELAKKMNLKSSDILTKLMSLGMMSTINSTIDYDTAHLLASEYECEVELISLYEQTIIEEKAIKDDVIISRSPVITIMGHVDHGKTTLLDLLRGSNVIENEYGNITQHIGAYQVHTDNSAITVLDTPGHFAFDKIRSRGASITDIIVLVIAVNDGIKPQTEESITLAKEKNIPIIVALNKIDLPNINEEKVLQELSEHDLLPEEWGGTIPICRISALKNVGIDKLLEYILLQSELLDLKASSKACASGIILESRVEKGRGTVLTVLVQNGVLRIGDPFVAGIYSGKVRALYDDNGKSMKECFSGTPVEVVGVEDTPSAGDPFDVTEKEKTSKQVSIKRQELDRNIASKNLTKVTADTLYSTIEADKVDYYNVIIKGDVHSSVEAIRSALLQLGNDEVKVKVIQSSIGAINENDVMLASTSNADIITFNTKPNSKIVQLAMQEKVSIERHSLIFSIIEQVRDKLNKMLSPEIREDEIAEAEVLDIFKVSKIGTIAGSKVLNGKVEKNALAKVYRNNNEIFSGTISSLKRHKDDVNSVERGLECGIGINNFNDFEIGDIVKVFKKTIISRSL